MSSWPDAVTFAQTWADAVAARRDAPFLVFEAPDGTVTEWTYGEFDSIVARMATELDSHAVGPGTSIHLALTNCPTFVALWLAANRLGAWIVPSDPMGRTTELAGFFFDGRRSDLLKVAGENVSTVEVEAVLSEHPMVLEASVVGAPDPVRDEVPVAFVVPADPADAPSTDELRGWCGERLGKAKIPRDITFLDELPRTSVGKIRKFELKEEVRAS